MKKYIAVIELDDDEEIVGDANISYTDRSNGTNYGTDESVELKAYDEGRSAETYEDGLNEAWELARDIITLPNSGNKSLTWVRHNVFGTDALFDLIMNYSASEIIEKIKKYEEIEVGDEVVDEKGWGIKGVVTKTNERYISIVENEGKVSRFNKSAFNKTGRHFPQIEEVLKQMQEGNE